ncbi:hypothetical protein pb186bvf_015222 [Paramecium bursaria]
MLSQSSYTKSTVENGNIIKINDYIVVQQLYIGKIYNLYLGIMQYELRQQFTKMRALRLILQESKVTNKETSHEIFFLTKLKGLNCVPRLHSYGEEQIKSVLYEYQVVDRLGPSIKLIYNYYNKNIPKPVLCLLAIQILNCLEQVHAQFVVHRNIRPKKLLNSMNGLYIALNDFKYASKYKKYIGYQENQNYKIQNKQFLNKYSSLNTHLGQIPTPKDDLESLAYILLQYSLDGTKARSKKVYGLKINEESNKQLKLKQLEVLKLTVIPEKEFKEAPLEFVQFLNSVRMSNMSDYPTDYDKYRQLFKKIIFQHGLLEKDIQLPWVQKNIIPSQIQIKEVGREDEFDEDEAYDNTLQKQETSLSLKVKEVQTQQCKFMPMPRQNRKRISYLQIPK